MALLAIRFVFHFVLCKELKFFERTAKNSFFNCSFSGSSSRITAATSTTTTTFAIPRPTRNDGPIPTPTSRRPKRFGDGASAKPQPRRSLRPPHADGRERVLRELGHLPGRPVRRATPARFCSPARELFNSRSPQIVPALPVRRQLCGGGSGNEAGGPRGRLRS